MEQTVNLGISIRNGKVVSILVNNDWRINPKYYRNIESAPLAELLLSSYRCSICNCIIDKENHFYHHDFRFCAECADKYKKMHNRRKCKICGQHEWECVC